MFVPFLFLIKYVSKFGCVAALIDRSNSNLRPSGTALIRLHLSCVFRFNSPNALLVVVVVAVVWLGVLVVAQVQLNYIPVIYIFYNIIL